MRVWTDHIQSHAVWQQLETLGPLVDQALSREDVSLPASSGLIRIKTVVAFTGNRLSTADSTLIPPSLLDGLASSFQNATAEVQNFVTNGNDAHIVNANSHVDNALVNVAQIVVPLTSNDLTGLREVADAYRTQLESNLQTAKGALATFQAELSGLKERLTTLAADISAEKQQLSSLASEHQSQFSTAQETRSKDYLEAQTSRQDKFATLIADYAQKLTDQTAEFGRQRDALALLHKEDLASLSASYREKAVKLLEEIQAHRGQVEKLVGVIGNLGVTSGYQKAANEARFTARIWQIMAVVALGAIILVAYKAFLPLVQGAFTWEGFAGRVFVSLTVGVLAAYAISQADKYQQVERKSRKFALELEALGPFVTSLPIEKQEEFRIRVGDRSFGTSDDLIDSDSARSPKSVFDVALKSKELRAFVVEIIKATRGAT